MKVSALLLLGASSLWAESWPAIPISAPGSTAARRVQVLVQPDPMEIARQRLRSGKLPLGLWRVMIWNPTDKPATISREQIEIQVPDVRFLSKEVALPILIDRSGGRWKQAAHYLMLAGMLAPGSLSAATISTRAVKWVGVGLAGLEILHKDLDAKTPDIAALTIEIPASITVPAGGGATFDAWAAKMARAHTYRFEVQ